MRSPLCTCFIIATSARVSNPLALVFIGLGLYLAILGFRDTQNKLIGAFIGRDFDANELSASRTTKGGTGLLGSAIRTGNVPR